MPELRIQCDKANKWYWILRKENKEIIARGRSYQGKKIAMEEALNIIKMKNDPEIIHYVVDNMEVITGGHTHV
jgi:uncharacterized protein YegP (UPF0339 family)